MEEEPTEPRFFIHRKGQFEGPFSVQAIRILLNRKEISGLAQVRREGTDNWITLAELPEMMSEETDFRMWLKILAIAIMVIIAAAAIVALLVRI